MKFELGAAEACCTRLNFPFLYFCMLLRVIHCLDRYGKLGPRFIASVLGAGCQGNGT